MTFASKVLVWAAVVGLCSAASAATVTFSEFSAGTALTTQSQDLGVVFNMSRGTALVEDETNFSQSPFQGNHLAVQTELGQDDVGFLTISFVSEGAPASVSASTVSFDLADLSTNPLVVVQSYAADASVLETFIVHDTVQSLQLSVGAPAFIVIIDVLRDGFLLDNFSFTPPDVTVFTPVPEPATLVPIGAALAGLAVRIHRRKKRLPPA